MADSGTRFPVRVLRRFAAGRPRVPTGDRCEMCAERLPASHSHLVALDTRALQCVCRACFLLFTHDGAAEGRFRAVPERYRRARDLALSDADWDELQVPVGMAFFFFNSLARRSVAFYPSPAGATESELPLSTWEGLLARDPALADIAPDVEALLTRRTASGFECYLVPIDACYELVGLIRRTWKGFDGGEEARREIEAFFATVRGRAGEGTAGGAEWAS